MRRTVPALPRAIPFAAVAAVALAACSADGLTAAAARRDAPGERVPLTRFRETPQPLTFTSGVGEPARLVVRDAPLWAATWTAIWGAADPVPFPALPSVDFAREMVVVVALGARSSGGHGIVVDSATRRGDTLRVHVRTFAPGPGCGAIAVITAPVDAARLPRHDGPIVFRERAEAPRCD